jgi:hypothetical protein
MTEEVKQRISAFVQLGKTMKELAESDTWPGFNCGLNKEEFTAFQQVVHSHIHHNGWFTPENIRLALLAWSEALTEENLLKWIAPYNLQNPANPKKVAIICAGNIPMVGLHDVISVLITGHIAYIKLSSDDDKLIPAILQLFSNLNPVIVPRIVFSEQRLSGHEAVIATGSNNTSRYFAYYFKDVPHIIRKGRTSVAVIRGMETDEEMKRLGHDIFDYFGLGCRNVSKVFVPVGFNLDRIFEAIYVFHPIINHNKYANNYDYNKAVWLLNREELLDNGFILFKQENRIASPTGSLFYEFYSDESKLKDTLDRHRDELQCVIGSNEIPFGESQKPQLWDYADDVDTIRFLSELH